MIDAAMELADERGGEHVSMRMIAERVDRSVASLYNHVGGRADLIEGMRARVVETIDVSGFADVTWDAGLAEWARSYLSAFARHPSLVRLLATTPIRDRSTYVMYEVVVSALVDGGWPEGDAVAVMRSVEAFVLGAALDAVAPPDLLSDDGLDDGFPTLRRTLAARHAERTSAAAAARVGLGALMDGLRARIERAG